MSIKTPSLKTAMSRNPLQPCLRVPLPLFESYFNVFNMVFFFMYNQSIRTPPIYLINPMVVNINLSLHYKVLVVQMLKPPLAIMLEPPLAIILDPKVLVFIWGFVEIRFLLNVGLHERFALLQVVLVFFSSYFC